MEKFNILFDGTIKPDYDPAEVRRNLASLLEVEEEALESLFAEEPVVIKGNVEQQTALNFLEAFENAGALCHIRPVDAGGTVEDLIQKLEKRSIAGEEPRPTSSHALPEKEEAAKPEREILALSIGPEPDDESVVDPAEAPETPPASNAPGKHHTLLGVLSLLICIPSAIIAGLAWSSRFPWLSRELEALIAWKPPTQGNFLLVLGVSGIVLCVMGIACGGGGLQRKHGKKRAPILGIGVNSLISLCIAAAIFHLHPPTSPSPETALETPPFKENTPPKTEPPTQKDFLAKKLSWTRRHTDAAWEKLESGKSSCLKSARQLVADAFRHLHAPPDKPTARELLTKGEALMHAKCGLPLVHLWHAMVLHALGNSERARPHARIAFVKTRQWDYPKSLSFLAARTMADIAREAEGKNGTSFKKWSSRAVDCMVDAILSGEFVEGEARIAWQLMENARSSFDFGECFERLKDVKGLDPWLLLMVEGESEIEAAWDARGPGRAYTVTREGWKGFHIHLNRASDALRGAWTLQPAAPEAPTKMIAIAMSRRDKKGESTRVWFDRAVEAQMDYPRAYEKYLLSLTPRWGGDYQKMHQFGLECLDGGRFDTDVPLVYLKALRETGKEIEYSRWFAPFRDPMVEKNLHRLFDGLLEEPTRAADRGRIRTCQALTRSWSGDYETAKTILAELGDDVELAPGFPCEPLSWSGTDLNVVRTELRAFTGPLGKRLKMAESLSLHKKVAPSISLLEETMREAREDAPLFEYLRERIALSRMGVRPEKLTSGISAIHLAARGSHIKVMRFLLKNGADVNGKNALGDGPLHIAALKGRDRMISYLVKKDANFDLRNNLGWTPLHKALASGKIKSARLLMQNGAHVDLPNNAGATPLHFALGYNLPDIAEEMIANSPDVNMKNREKDAPLHLALRGEEANAVRMLVEQGANVNAQNGRGNSPLHIAVTLKLEEMVGFLLESGADVNGVNGEKWPPLHLAIYYDARKIAGLLLDRGADIHQRLTDGWTPLHLAVEYGRAELTRLLLERGSNCTDRLSDGRTALLIARENEDVNLIEILTGYIRSNGKEEEIQRLHQKIKTSREWVDKGFQDIKEKKPRVALEHFKQAAEADPDFVMAPYGIGLAYSDLGEKKSAFEYFKQAIKIDRNHASPFVDWGSALMTSGQLDEGIRLYKRAAQVDPKNTPANMTLFNYYISVRDCRKASRHFTRIPSEMPEWQNFRKKFDRNCPNF